MKKAKQLAVGGMFAALAVVLMLAGGLIGIGTYASPMLAGICMIPMERECGKKMAMTVWIAVSLLSFFLVADVEESLAFFFVFGWYPIIRSSLEPLKKGLKIAVKLLIFNAAILAVELLVMLVLIPSAVTPVIVLLILLMGNVLLWLYDLVIPKMQYFYEKKIRKMMRM